jgi:hypothetical protein
VIAYTTLGEGCALISNQTRLTARAKEQGVEVLTTVEPLGEFGFVLPAPSGTD